MRRRHRRLPANADLDITAFMNLMIVLVPVLLLGMVFSQIRMIDLDFPGDSDAEPLTAESLQLVVTLLPDGLEVRDSERGVIRRLPRLADGQDYEGLRQTLRSIKARLPDKTDVVLEVAAEMDYQTLIHTMDTVRSYPAVVAASVVDAELFPDVALANAPDDRTLALVTEGHQR
ncbi:MAG: biopolymer transporter ExbD [Marinobacter sp.]|uniref:ExbD/TolR family protein n=1 Tax=Marinobacter sp. TaxID=50741 RepID=UPI00299DE3C3|nr:biopolymer transporter ExbD [Marinobacter sp.]MDX1633166.1 biopolymer transporter ExbD [Marinobacter sp.]